MASRFLENEVLLNRPWFFYFIFYFGFFLRQTTMWWLYWKPREYKKQMQNQHIRKAICVKIFAKQIQIRNSLNQAVRFNWLSCFANWILSNILYSNWRKIFISTILFRFYLQMLFSRVEANINAQGWQSQWGHRGRGGAKIDGHPKSGSVPINRATPVPLPPLSTRDLIRNVKYFENIRNELKLKFNFKAVANCVPMHSTCSLFIESFVRKWSEFI